MRETTCAMIGGEQVCWDTYVRESNGSLREGRANLPWLALLPYHLRRAGVLRRRRERHVQVRPVQ